MQSSILLACSVVLCAVIGCSSATHHMQQDQSCIFLQTLPRAAPHLKAEQCCMELAQGDIPQNLVHLLLQDIWFMVCASYVHQLF